MSEFGQVLPLHQNVREVATFAMRLLAFGASLAVVGAFFLPWVWLDGSIQTSTGAELIAIALSPTVNYLWLVSPLQTSILIGAPSILIVSALMVVAQYSRRKTAPLTTGVVFASASAIVYGTPNLTVISEAGTPIGLQLTIALSVVLLVHQALIVLREKLRYSRRLQTVHQTLSVVTGSGYYRWND